MYHDKQPGRPPKARPVEHGYCGQSLWGLDKNVQAIGSEMGAYSKRTFDESTATFERLIGAKSVEQALEIQAEFAIRTVEDYVQQMTKIGTMYSDIAKDAYKPFDDAVNGNGNPKRNT